MAPAWLETSGTGGYPRTPDRLRMDDAGYSGSRSAAGGCLATPGAGIARSGIRHYGQTRVLLPVVDN